MNICVITSPSVPLLTKLHSTAYSKLWFCTQPCFAVLNYITFTFISSSQYCYHYYQNLCMEFLLQISLWWFLHVFCISVTFTLLLAVSLTLPLLQHHHQQQNQQQLTSPPQPLCMLLLLTVLSPSLLSVEAADDSVTSHFQHNYFHSSCYKAYCLDLLFTAVSHKYSSLCHTFTVDFLYVWHTRQSLIIPSLKFQDTAFPQRKHKLFIEITSFGSTI